ncbi:MAG: hypothetical protein ACM31L_17160 [Actinomycetota bacterium]
MSLGGDGGGGADLLQPAGGEPSLNLPAPDAEAPVFRSAEDVNPTVTFMPKEQNKDNPLEMSTVPRRPHADPGLGNDPANLPLPGGGLLAAAEPKAQPKPPLADHTVDAAGAAEHEAWAKQLAGREDMSGAVPTLARAVKDYGEQGRGDVSDLLVRLHGHDPAAATRLQAELKDATGELLPFRLAPFGRGFEGDLTPPHCAPAADRARLRQSLRRAWPHHRRRRHAGPRPHG